VLAGDMVIKTFSIDSTRNSEQDMRYARFHAGGTSTKLAFKDTSGYFAVGPVIDKVTVQQCLLVLCLPG
jgi:hypothetical protein